MKIEDTDSHCMYAHFTHIQLDAYINDYHNIIMHIHGQMHPHDCSLCNEYLNWLSTIDLDACIRCN